VEQLEYNLNRLKSWRIFSLPRTLHDLGVLGDESAVEPMLPFMDHPMAPVREAACEALASIRPLRPSPAVDKLFDRALDRSPRVRAMALWTLGQLYMAMEPGSGAAPGDRPVNVSYKLFWATTREKALRAMERGLLDPHPEVRNICRVFRWVLEATDTFPVFEGGE